MFLSVQVSGEVPGFWGPCLRTTHVRSLLVHNTGESLSVNKSVQWGPCLYKTHVGPCFTILLKVRNMSIHTTGEVFVSTKIRWSPGLCTSEGRSLPIHDWPLSLRWDPCLHACNSSQVISLLVHNLYTTQVRPLPIHNSGETPVCTKLSYGPYLYTTQVRSLWVHNSDEIPDFWGSCLYTS